MDEIKNIKNIKLNNINFFNFPRKYSIDDYMKIQNEIAYELSSYKDIVGIYNIGSFSAPGISDIDMLIIFDDDITKTRPTWVEKLASKTNYRRILYKKLKIGGGKKERKKSSDLSLKDYIMIHPPLIVPKSSIEHISKLVALFDNPKSIYKRYFHDIRKTDRKYFLNIYLDYPMMSECLELLSFLINRNINVRRALIKLNNIKYTMYMAKSFGVWENFYNEYINAVQKLRKVWFNLTKNQQMECIYLLLRQYINISFELIWSAAYEITDFFNIKIDKNKILFYTNPKRYTIFTDKFNKNEILNKQIRLIREGLSVNICPYVYSIQLQAYSSRNNPWARFLRKYMFGHILNSDFSFIPNLDEVVNALSHYNIELKKRNLLLGMGPPSFGYEFTEYPWIVTKYKELRVRLKEKQFKNILFKS